jgi:hypothetical protein
VDASNEGQAGPTQLNVKAGCAVRKCLLMVCWATLSFAARWEELQIGSSSTLPSVQCEISYEMRARMFLSVQ